MPELKAEVRDPPGGTDYLARARTACTRRGMPPYLFLVVGSRGEPAWRDEMMVEYYGEGDACGLRAETFEDERFIAAAQALGLSLAEMIYEAAEMGLIEA